MTQVVSADGAMGKQSRALNTPIDRFIIRLSHKIGGGKAKEVERFIKFAIVGLIGAAVDFGTLNILLATVLPPVDNVTGEPLGFAVGSAQIDNVAIAATIAFIAAVLSNFTWNRVWTYPDSRSRSLRRQLSQFAFVSLIGWSARTLWIQVSYLGIGAMASGVIQWVSTSFVATPESTAKLGANLAQLVGVFVVMIWNFFINRYWTYNDVE